MKCNFRKWGADEIFFQYMHFQWQRTCQLNINFDESAQLHLTVGIYYGGGLLCGGLKFHFGQNDWSEILKPKWNSLHPNSHEPFQRTDKELKWDFHLNWIFKSVWVHFGSHLNVLQVRIGITLTGILRSICKE